MEDLTVKQIKEKQLQLKADLKEILDKFYKETGLNVTGNITYGINSNLQGVNLTFSDLFN